MDLMEIGWEDAEWVQMAQDRDQWRAVVNTVMDLRDLAPQSSYMKIRVKDDICKITKKKSKMCVLCTQW
jgi:hypothetical protein